MHASRPSSEPGFWQADAAVSEVVGQILMFGILSMVLVLSLFSFNVAKENTEERIVSTTAESVAQRVASLVVETALFAEKFEEQEVELQSDLELPDLIEGGEYTITLDGDDVIVFVGKTEASATAPLFSAGSTGLVHICSQDALDGGAVRIRIAPDAVPGDGTSDLPAGADCDVPGTEPEFYVYLEKP